MNLFMILKKYYDPMSPNPEASTTYASRYTHSLADVKKALIEEGTEVYKFGELEKVKKVDVEYTATLEKV